MGDFTAGAMDEFFLVGAVQCRSERRFLYVPFDVHVSQSIVLPDFPPGGGSVDSVYKRRISLAQLDYTSDVVRRATKEVTVRSKHAHP
jgi:hypothetical protein